MLFTLAPSTFFDGCSSGIFTGSIIRMISNIRANGGTDTANLSNCGKFTLADDLSELQDITAIDLSYIDSLEGE